MASIENIGKVARPKTLPRSIDARKRLPGQDGSVPGLYLPIACISMSAGCGQLLAKIVKEHLSPVPVRSLYHLLISYPSDLRRSPRAQWFC